MPAKLDIPYRVNDKEITHIYCDMLRINPNVEAITLEWRFGKENGNNIVEYGETKSLTIENRYDENGKMESCDLSILLSDVSDYLHDNGISDSIYNLNKYGSYYAIAKLMYGTTCTITN